MLDRVPAPTHVLFAEASNEANHLYRSFQTSEWTLPGNALCTLTGLESPRLITMKVNRGTSDADRSDNRIYRIHQSEREGLANKQLITIAAAVLSVVAFYTQNRGPRTTLMF